MRIHFFARRTLCLAWRSRRGAQRIVFVRFQRAWPPVALLEHRVEAEPGGRYLRQRTRRWRWRADSSAFGGGA